MAKTERALLGRVQAVMEEHLVLAKRYENAGNHDGAARLRTLANMLGMMLRGDEPVPPLLADGTDEEIKPRPDGFEAYWQLRGKDALFLANNVEDGLKEALHDAWAVAQFQVLEPTKNTVYTREDFVPGELVKIIGPSRFGNGPSREYGQVMEKQITDDGSVMIAMCDWKGDKTWFAYPPSSLLKG